MGCHYERNFHVWHRDAAILDRSSRNHGVFIEAQLVPGFGVCAVLQQP